MPWWSCSEVVRSAGASLAALGRRAATGGLLSWKRISTRSPARAAARMGTDPGGLRRSALAAKAMTTLVSIAASAITSGRSSGIRTSRLWRPGPSSSSAAATSSATSTGLRCTSSAPARAAKVDELPSQQADPVDGLLSGADQSLLLWHVSSGKRTLRCQGLPGGGDRAGEKVAGRSGRCRPLTLTASLSLSTGRPLREASLADDFGNLRRTGVEDLQVRRGQCPGRGRPGPATG